jgi:hypothetical protein
LPSTITNGQKLVLSPRLREENFSNADFAKKQLAKQKPSRAKTVAATKNGAEEKACIQSLLS